MIQAVIVLHLAWAVLLLIGGAQHTTAIDSVLNLVGDYRIAAAVYAFAGLLAMAGLRFEERLSKRGLGWVIACFAPQQFLLFMAFGTAVRAIGDEKFADGVKRGWTFIASDQSPSIIFAIYHIKELLERYHVWDFIRDKVHNISTTK